MEETEEGEIGFSPQLKDEKISGNNKDLLSAVMSPVVQFFGQENLAEKKNKFTAVFMNLLLLTLTGPRRVNSSDVNQNVNMDDLTGVGLCEGPANKKLKTGTGVETKCNIFRRDTPGPHPREEETMIKKTPDAAERIVFPLDLNDGKEDDDEMVDDNPRALGNDSSKQRSLGMVPNLELALGEDETTTTTGSVLPFMARPSATEKHRSSSSQKAEEDSAASLSLSLSFSPLEKEQQQQQRQQQNQRQVSGWEHKKQNVNTPMFLFRNFPDKSS